MIIRNISLKENIIKFLNIYMILILLSGVIDLFINKLNISVLSFWPEIIFLMFMTYYIMGLINQGTLSKSKWFFITFIVISIFLQLFVSQLNTSVLQFIFGYKVTLFYLPIYLIFYFFDKSEVENNIIKITKIISVMAIVMLLIGIIQKILGYTNLLKIYGNSISGFTTKGILRVFSSTKSPFEYAWACIISALVCFSYILFENKKNKVVNIGFVCSVLGIILSSSREGILNLVVGIFTIVISRISLTGKLGKIFIKLYLFVIPLVGVLVFSIVQNIANMTINTDNVYINILLSANSFNERFTVWKNAINMYEMKSITSILFGNGLGSIGAAQQLMNKLGYSMTTNPVDNLYLYLYLNIGIIGTIFVIGFLYFNLNTIVNSLEYVSCKYYQVSVIAIISSVFVGGYFRSVIEGLIVQVVLLYMLGTSYSIARNKESVGVIR